MSETMIHFHGGPLGACSYPVTNPLPVALVPAPMDFNRKKVGTELRLEWAMPGTYAQDTASPGGLCYDWVP